MGAFSAVILSGSPFRFVRNPPPTQIYLPFGESCPYLRYATVLSIWLTFLEGKSNLPTSESTEGPIFHTSNRMRHFFQGIQEGSQVWMSHSDTIDQLPEKGVLLASTDDVENAAFRIEGETTYGIQFHPEVYHTQDGKQLLENFLIHIAGIQQQWTPDSFVEMTVKDIRETVGSEKVILGLSGGVDSTVAAVLLHKAIGDRLHCIFVNNGLLRKNEFESVLNQYEGMGLNVAGVDASEQFLDGLKGETDPEKKKKNNRQYFHRCF